MTVLFNLVLVLFLLPAIVFPPTSPIMPTPLIVECTSMYGVKSGDTCIAVEQIFHLTTAEFEEINPNLNCEALFVGQWLCIKGFLL
ncbi:hypothetical protein BT93_L2450 [Corymbia citriodora subsp. variegata]|uniref:LysM domain-containing protein n=1 Tax=Corymbia citriodora subsp. variegata TaxID=360336 RepID=A0A8T0CL06_CORYI|nr:hypothetical protein BT93_L2450 [Corymbia citriodora subsp. variegata]